MKSIIIIPPDDKKKDIDWDEVVKKQEELMMLTYFGEIQLIMGYTVITEKGIADKDRFYLPKKACR